MEILYWILSIVICMYLRKKSKTVHSSPTSAAYMCQWTGSSLVQEMAAVWRQAITWTSADFLSVEPLGTNFNEIWIRILSFSFKKKHLKMLSAKMAAILSREGISLVA